MYVNQIFPYMKIEKVHILKSKHLISKYLTSFQKEIKFKKYLL